MKKSKMIKAFIYRTLSLVLMLLTVFCGSLYFGEFMKSGFKGAYLLLYGNPTGMSECNSSLWELFDKGILAYAGLDYGQSYVLTDSVNISTQSKKEFEELISRSSDVVVYCVYNNRSKRVVASNVNYPVFTSENGSNLELILPDKATSYIYWDGSVSQHNTLGPMHTLPYIPNKSVSSELSFLIATTDTPLYYAHSPFSSMYNQAYLYRNLLYIFLAAFCLFVILQLFVICSRKAWKAARASYGAFSVRICLELKLVLFAAVLYTLYSQFTRYTFQLTFHNRDTLPADGIVSLCIGGFIAFLLWTDLRVNGAHIFHVFLPSFIYRYAHTYQEALPWEKRIMLRCQMLGLAGICFFFLLIGLYDILPLSRIFSTEISQILFLLLLLASIAAVIYSMRGIYLFYKEARRLADILSRVRQGNFVPADEEAPYVFLQKPYEDLTELEKGMETAVSLKSKADRMRVELITNVSHDLKTPLTSIMNYADLLCEEPLSPPASEYASALRDKSYTLKNMVQDVFELSKASSGSLPIEKATLDLCKLISQTLADMEERISTSALSFKTTLPEYPMYTEGDGNKLYRVFQNLYVNTLRYSLENSRVFTQVTHTDTEITVKIKNTSKNELTFNTEEIIDRFVRADSSRTTEGSGLGLSIAQSFTEACGGHFHIETDADMFTAIITFPIADAPVVQAQEEEMP